MAGCCEVEKSNRYSPVVRCIDKATGDAIWDRGGGRHPETGGYHLAQAMEVRLVNDLVHVAVRFPNVLNPNGFLSHHKIRVFDVADGSIVYDSDDLIIQGTFLGMAVDPVSNRMVVSYLTSGPVGQYYFIDPAENELTQRTLSNGLSGNASTAAFSVGSDLFATGNASSTFAVHDWAGDLVGTSLAATQAANGGENAVLVLDDITRQHSVTPSWMYLEAAQQFISLDYSRGVYTPGGTAEFDPVDFIVEEESRDSTLIVGPDADLNSRSYEREIEEVDELELNGSGFPCANLGEDSPAAPWVLLSDRTTQNKVSGQFTLALGTAPDQSTEPYPGLVVAPAVSSALYNPDGLVDPVEYSTATAKLQSSMNGTPVRRITVGGTSFSPQWTFRGDWADADTASDLSDMVLFLNTTSFPTVESDPSRYLGLIYSEKKSWQTLATSGTHAGNYTCGTLEWFIRPLENAGYTVEDWEFAQRAYYGEATFRSLAPTLADRPRFGNRYYATAGQVLGLCEIVDPAFVANSAAVTRYGFGVLGTNEIVPYKSLTVDSVELLPSGANLTTMAVSVPLSVASGVAVHYVNDQLYLFEAAEWEDYEPEELTILSQLIDTYGPSVDFRPNTGQAFFEGNDVYWPVTIGSVSGTRECLVKFDYTTEEIDKVFTWALIGNGDTDGNVPVKVDHDDTRLILSGFSED